MAPAILLGRRDTRDRTALLDEAVDGAGVGPPEVGTGGDAGDAPPGQVYLPARAMSALVGFRASTLGGSPSPATAEFRPWCWGLPAPVRPLTKAWASIGGLDGKEGTFLLCTATPRRSAMSGWSSAFAIAEAAGP